MTVVVRELATSYQGRLRVGLIDQRDEAALMARFGVVVTPAVVYMRDGQPQRARGAHARLAGFLAGRRPSARRRCAGSPHWRKRMTEHVLVWHPKVPGDAPAESDEQLRLIGMPTGLVRPARPTAAGDELTAGFARRHERSGCGPPASHERAGRSADPRQPERTQRSREGDDRRHPRRRRHLGEGRPGQCLLASASSR